MHCRHPDLHDESPGSSEYSTGSTILSQTAGDKTEQAPAVVTAPNQDIGAEIQSIQSVQQNSESRSGIHISPITNQGKQYHVDWKVYRILDLTHVDNMLHI